MCPKMWFPLDNFSNVRQILMKFGNKLHGKMWFPFDNFSNV